METRTKKKSWIKQYYCYRWTNSIINSSEQAGVNIKEEEDKTFEKLKELSNNGLKVYEKMPEAINMFSLEDIDVMDSYSFEAGNIKDNIPSSK